MGLGESFWEMRSQRFHGHPSKRFERRGCSSVLRLDSIPMTRILAPLFAAVVALNLLALVRAQDAKPAEPKAGNYLLTLEMGEKKPRINVEIQGKAIRSVKSTDPELEGMKGEILAFKTQGRVIPSVDAGAFLVRMRNDKHAMSQLWIFRKDGSAAVREVPDRGEMQSAVPVKEETIEVPK